MKVPLARDSASPDSVDHVITNISRDMIMSVHNEIGYQYQSARQARILSMVTPVWKIMRPKQGICYESARLYWYQTMECHLCQNPKILKVLSFIQLFTNNFIVFYK